MSCPGSQSCSCTHPRRTRHSQSKRHQINYWGRLCRETMPISNALNSTDAAHAYTQASHIPHNNVRTGTLSNTHTHTLKANTQGRTHTRAPQDAHLEEMEGFAACEGEVVTPTEPGAEEEREREKGEEKEVLLGLHKAVALTGDVEAAAVLVEAVEGEGDAEADAGLVEVVEGGGDAVTRDTEGETLPADADAGADDMDAVLVLDATNDADVVKI